MMDVFVQNRIQTFLLFSKKLLAFSAHQTLIAFPDDILLYIYLGSEFDEKLDRYMRPAIRKGVPPLFVNLRSLYDNKEKVNCPK